MKKVVVFVLFLFLVGFTVAMDGPIKVMAGAGNLVSVNIRNVDKITMNRDSGVADSDGVFVAKTFFSLEPPYNIRIIITNADGDFIDFDKDVGEVGFEGGMEIDCKSGNCVVSAVEVPIVEVVEDVVDEVVVVNESNDSVVVEEVEEDRSGGVLLAGKALLLEDNGSVKWIYPGIGSVVLLFFLVFVVVVFRRGRAKGKVLDEDEKELEEMEKKVKETGEKIKKVRDGKERRVKIYKAKLKLAEEEDELSQLLESGRSSEGRVEEQRKDIEKAEEKVEKIEKKVKKDEGSD